MKNLLTAIAIFVPCLLIAQAPQQLTLDQSKKLVIDNPSKMILPPGYNAGKKYPLVIFLPCTGATATDMFSGYTYQANESSNVDESSFAALLKAYFGNEMDKKSFILMLPDGAGSTADHDWKGFSASIYRYENRIFTDIETYSKKYSIDPDKIILFGYSLGADMAWAITNRYPEKFKGAILSGSRCSYSEKGMIQRLAKKNARFYITMGDQEQDARMKGAKAAITILNNAKIKNIPVTVHAPRIFCFAVCLAGNN